MITQATRVLIICTDVRPLLQSPYVVDFVTFNSDSLVNVKSCG